MKTRITRKTVLPAAALMTLSALLAGCSGGGEKTAQPAGEETTSSVQEVSDDELGEALDVLVYHGTSEKSTDGGACFVSAVKDSGVSAEGQASLIESVAGGSDDLTALAEEMQESNPEDALILASSELGSELEACVDTQTEGQDSPEPSDGGGEKDEEKTYESPKAPAPEEEEEQEANLEPTYPMDDDRKIQSASELTDGLIVIFSSYALDEHQKKVYEEAGECFSEAVFDAGFSQETLRFLAEGPKMGSGSVSDYLPNDEDKVLWESQEFTTELMNCQLTASSTVQAGGDVDEEEDSTEA